MKEYLSFIEDARIKPSNHIALKAMSNKERIAASTSIYQSLFMKLQKGQATKELGTKHENYIEKYFLINGQEVTNTNLPNTTTGFFDLMTTSKHDFFSVKINHPRSTWNQWISDNFAKDKKWLVNNTVENVFLKNHGINGKMVNFYLLRGTFEKGENDAVVFVLELSNGVSGRQILAELPKWPDDKKVVRTMASRIWQPQSRFGFVLSEELENKEIMAFKDTVKKEIIQQTFVSPKSFVNKLENIAEKAKAKFS